MKQNKLATILLKVLHEVYMRYVKVIHYEYCLQNSVFGDTLTKISIVGK